MPTYTYACPACGTFDETRAMAHRGDPARCPACSRSSRRVFQAPALLHASPALNRAVEQAGRSAEAPEVTTAIPPAAGRPVRPRSGRPYPPLPRP